MGLLWLAAGELDTIALGDEVAARRGQPVQAVRAALVLACSIISGAAVAAAGLVTALLGAPFFVWMLRVRRDG